MWRMMKNMAECARSAVILDGEISKYVVLLQGVAQGCTLSPNIFNIYIIYIYIYIYIYIKDLAVAVEAPKQGATVGEDRLSGLMFADYFVGISDTPEGLQKQLEGALEYTRKWRVTANAKECADGACKEDQVNPVISVGSGERMNCRSWISAYT